MPGLTAGWKAHHPLSKYLYRGGDIFSKFLLRCHPRCFFLSTWTSTPMWISTGQLLARLNGFTTRLQAKRLKRTRHFMPDLYMRMWDLTVFAANSRFSRVLMPLTRCRRQGVIRPASFVEDSQRIVGFHDRFRVLAGGFTTRACRESTLKGNTNRLRQQAVAWMDS